MADGTPVASMEPRSFDRGDLAAFRFATAFLLASMEPRSFDRGDSPDIGHYAGRPAASMEPRSFDRGDAAVASPCGPWGPVGI